MKLKIVATLIGLFAFTSLTIQAREATTQVNFVTVKAPRDLNGDGVISKAEIRAHRKATKRKRCRAKRVRAIRA